MFFLKEMKINSAGMTAPVKQEDQLLYEVLNFSKRDGQLGKNRFV